jgi:DNA-binding transcriptional ArsR family regulator
MLNNVGLDRVFHALAEPTRRAIVERLSTGPSSVSELAKPFDMTLAAVVQHLQVLEQSGLVRSEKIGRTRTCRIEPTGLDAASRWLAERRALWERRFDRLGEVLGEAVPAAAAAPAPPKARSRRSRPNQPKVNQKRRES